MASFSSYLASLSSASLGSLIFLAIAVLFPSKIASYEKKTSRDVLQNVSTEKQKV